MLDEYLLLHDFIVHHSIGDADLLIVRTAVQCAESILVGEDTDLLVFLCYYVDQSAYYAQSSKIEHSPQSGLEHKIYEGTSGA